MQSNKLSASRLYRRLLTAGACCMVAASASLFAAGNSTSTPKAMDDNQAQVTVNGLQLNQQAPDFRLQDQDGKEVALSDTHNKFVVLEWTNPNCPYVKRHYKEGTMKNLYNKYKDQGVVWIAIDSSSNDTTGFNKEWASAQSIDYPVLDDASGTAGHAYGAKTTPEMYIIDKDGKVVYLGGIDNDPEGNKGEGKINYVDRALGELLAGKHVTIPETKSYGCHVGYAAK